MVEPAPSRRYFHRYLVKNLNYTFIRFSLEIKYTDSSFLRKQFNPEYYQDSGLNLQVERFSRNAWLRSVSGKKEERKETRVKVA